MGTKFSGLWLAWFYERPHRQPAAIGGIQPHGSDTSNAVSVAFELQPASIRVPEGIALCGFNRIGAGGRKASLPHVEPQSDVIGSTVTGIVSTSQGRRTGHRPALGPSSHALSTTLQGY